MKKNTRTKGNKIRDWNVKVTPTCMRTFSRIVHWNAIMKEGLKWLGLVLRMKRYRLPKNAHFSLPSWPDGKIAVSEQGWKEVIKRFKCNWNFIGRGKLWSSEQIGIKGERLSWPWVVYWCSELLVVIVVGYVIDKLLWCFITLVVFQRKKTQN